VRRRLLLANLAVVIAVLAVLEVPLALVYSRHEHDALETALQRDAAALAAVSGEVIEHRDEHDVGAVAQTFATQPGEIVAIVDADGATLTPPTLLSNDPVFLDAVRAARSGESRTGQIDDLTYVALPVGAGGEGGHGAVLIARSDESLDDRVHQFWLLLAVIGGGVLATTLLVTTRLSRWVVDPLSSLDEQAAALGRGDLTARAVTEEGPPEVVTLAATFNDMAERLGELVTSQRRFVADASHQLRTPLTALRLRLEDLRSEDPTAVVSARDAALDEVARLTRLVDGLLSLARAEGHRPQRDAVDVSAVVIDRQEAWAPLAAEQGIDLRSEIRVPAPVIARLVPGHLEQILDNLIDNALDASPPDGTIVLRVTPLGSGIEVHVIDEGQGMTDEERRRAFDPFWQSSNDRATGTTGLGLAIVEQLVRACGGTITLDPAEPHGIDAVIRFA
jgi:signal transduction histidine kinase